LRNDLKSEISTTPGPERSEGPDDFIPSEPRTLNPEDIRAFAALRARRGTRCSVLTEFPQPT